METPATDLPQPKISSKKPSRLKKEDKRWFIIILASAAVIHAAIWVLLLWKLPYSEETVFLHYNIYFGIDLTGSWGQLLWMPLSALAALVVNGLVMFTSKLIDRRILYFVGWFTLVLQLAVLLASLLVVLLNG